MVNVRGEAGSGEQAQAAPRPAASPVNETVDTTLQDLVHIITQRKKLVALVTAICAGIAVAVAFMLPSEYTAHVAIATPQSSSSVSPATWDSSKDSDKDDSIHWLDKAMPPRKNNNAMYVAMLRSRPVEDAVIQRFSLQSEYRTSSPEETRAAFERHAGINGSADDGLIRLTVIDRDPTRAAEIANGYADQFRSVSQHLALTEASHRRQLFQNQLEKTNSDLKAAEDAFQKTRLATGALQFDEKFLAIIESAARLRAQIVAKQLQIEAMRGYAREDDPALTLAQTQLDGLEGNFDSLVKAKKDASGDALLKKRAASAAELEYLRKLRDVKFNQATSYLLARHLELARIDETRADASIHVVAPAVVPGESSSPHRAFIVVGGIAGGLTLGIMLALLQGGLHRAQRNTATKNNLHLLRMAVWPGGLSRGNKTEDGGHQEALRPLGHAG